MFFSIDPHNGVAIYEQVVRQVKFAIADTTLRPGQLLPSVRVLSQQLAINPNTINRAFQVLQADGILESMRGRGLAVREGARESCIAARRSLINDRLTAVLSEALHAGFDNVEIQSMVTEKLEKLVGSVPTVSSSQVSSEVASK